MPLARSHQFPGVLDLGLKLFAVRQRVIHHEDIHQFQIQLLHHRLEGGIGFEYVDVHVNWTQSRQRFQRSWFQTRPPIHDHPQFPALQRPESRK